MADTKDDNKPTIIIKKGGHGGHHGGAWKIAYADFTTAMMCFFLCMWLINSASVTTREAIASYFRKPTIFNEGLGQPLLLGGEGILTDAYSPPRNKPKVEIKENTEQDRTYGEVEKDLDKLYVKEGRFEPIKHKGPTEVTGLNTPLEQIKETQQNIKIRALAQDAKQRVEAILKTTVGQAQALGLVQVKVEPDGLKIEIMDTDKYSMFDSGSARIKPEAEAAFRQVVDVIKRYPNSIEISGHTDAQPFPTRTGGYTNWELSADRANSARRLIESQGYPSSRIAGVSGKASSDLRRPDAPLDPSNRRITLKLKFQTATNFLDNSEQQESYNDPLKELLQSEAAQNPPPVSSPGATPTITATPTETPLPIPSTASTSSRIQLPGNPVNPSNPDYMPKDKIFDDMPVLGPRDVVTAPN
jgi:chemotaxis protein MotB